MPKTYEVNGVTYQFPDNFSDEKAQEVLTKQGIIKPSAPPSVKGEGLIARGKKDLEIGWRSGAADLAHTTANVANTIPIPAVRDFGKRAEEYAQKEAPNPRDVAGHQGVIDQVVQAAGQVPSQLAKFAPAMAARKYGPLVGGAISAAGEMDKGWKAAAKAGAEGALTFYAMDKAGGIKRLAPRVAASAAVMAAPTAIESGGDIRKTAAAAITGGAFGVPGHGERLTKAQAAEALKGGMDTAAALGDEVKRYFAPQTMTPQAETGGRIFRKRLAEMQISSSRVDYALAEAKKAFSKMSPDETREFYRTIEPANNAGTRATSGDGAQRQFGNASPQMTKFAKAIGQVLDDKRDQVIRETGRLKEFYTDYFPRIWKDPEKASEFTRNFYGGKRPLQGGGTRFRQRIVPTIEDGLSGWTDAERNEHPPLELAHDNPVDAVLATVRELDRFLMAKRIIKDLRPQSTKHPEGLGILKFVREGRPVPRGYREINDKAFKVQSLDPKRIRAADTTSITTDIDPASKGTLVTPQAKPKSRAAGQWVAPDAVAQIFNNYLSPGLSHSMIYRGMRAVGNVLNQAQLGFSAFHAGFTSVDAVVSRFALGIEQVAHGARTADPAMLGKGAASIASSPLAPVTNAIKGWNLRRALLDPDGVKNPRMGELAELARMAGARADVDPIYKTKLREKMMTAFRQDKPLLGLLRLPGSLIEMSAAPLMDHFVPWQKLGVFADLARFEMDKIEAGASQGRVTSPLDTMRVMQKVWDSVDNRMGQLVYDNLFWNKTVKDLGMLGIRSVGWNLGTVREVVGGVKDWGEFFKDTVTPQQRAEFTHRMAYVTALPMVVGLMGAISNYLFTGEGPKDWKDYLAPRTGRKDEGGHDERIWFPSYLKDVYHYATDPLATAEGKLHPMFSTISQMLHNEDFSGVQIVNHDDPLIQQLLEAGGYAAEQFSPLWVKTAASREAGPETPWAQKLAAFVGVVPAPASLKRSTAENYASKVMSGELPRADRTREQEQERVALRQINAAIRAHTDPMPLIKQAIADDVLSEYGIRKSIKGNMMNYTPLARDISKIRNIEHAMKAFELATPAERRTLLPLMAKKLSNERDKIKQLPGGRRERVAREAANIIHLAQQLQRAGGTQ